MWIHLKEHFSCSLVIKEVILNLRVLWRGDRGAHISLSFRHVFYWRQNQNNVAMEPWGKNYCNVWSWILLIHSMTNNINRIKSIQWNSVKTNSSGSAIFVQHNRVDFCSKRPIGTEIFVRYNWVSVCCYRVCYYRVSQIFITI